MYLLFLVLFHSHFCFILFFCLWQEEVGGGGGSMLSPGPTPPSVSSDQQTVQDGGSALLQPTIVQCCGCVEKKRLCSYLPGPLLGKRSTRPVREPCYCSADSASQSLFIRRGRGVIKNASYSGPENSSLLPERSHFFPVLFVPLLTQQTTRPSCCDRGPPCAATAQLNHLTTMAHIYQQRAADISQEDRKIVH